MKFIPGTRFINNTMSNTKLFKRSTLYVLNNIKPNDNMVVYTFKVGNELKDVTFNSVQQADEWLERIVIN
jgi:hypothetical protein